MFIYIFAGGLFGLFVGVPYAALLGHGCLWLTRNAPERLLSTTVLIGTVLTALIVGVGNSLVQAGDADIELGGLATLIAMMSVCGALAGSFAAFLFVIVRRAIARPPATLADHDFDEEDIDTEGKHDHA
jgi:hypothetical protein